MLEKEDMNKRECQRGLGKPKVTERDQLSYKKGWEGQQRLREGVGPEKKH